jgi:hypothetical protein
LEFDFVVAAPTQIEILGRPALDNRQSEAQPVIGNKHKTSVVFCFPDATMRRGAIFGPGP